MQRNTTYSCYNCHKVIPRGAIDLRDVLAVRLDIILDKVDVTGYTFYSQLGKLLCSSGLD